MSPVPPSTAAAETVRQQHTEIRNGIEWYSRTGLNGGIDTDCSCARCGSSCDWLRCWNCDEGYVERNVGDDCLEELEDFPCEYCKGTGGTWHCLSTPEWCESHPLPGREYVISTALNASAWTEND